MHVCNCQLDAEVIAGISPQFPQHALARDAHYLVPTDGWYGTRGLVVSKYCETPYLANF